MAATRKQRSLAWSYFKPNDDHTGASCNSCGRTIKTSCGSTTGMFKHLESVHSIKLSRNAPRGKQIEKIHPCPNQNVVSLSAISTKGKLQLNSKNNHLTPKKLVAITGVPSNDSELQLFRVLQRANLLSYFDMMIELGGDDVQQLCDAGEEEFLEIMALIGMASKPLHVRRLQKALQEWMTQPSLFQAPVLPPGYTSGSNAQIQQTLPHLAAASGVGQLPISHMASYSPAPTAVPVLYPGAPGLIPTPSDLKGSTNSARLANEIKNNGLHFSDVLNGSIGNPHVASNPLVAALALQQAALAGEGGLVSPQLAAIFNNLSPNANHQLHQQHQSRHNHHSTSSNGRHSSNSKHSERDRISSSLLPPMQMSDIKIPADQLIPSHFLETRIRTRSEASSPISSFAGSPHPESRNSVSPIPSALQDHEVQKLAETAIQLIRSLPSSVAEPKFSSKRKTSGDYELILRLSDSDPRRMEEVRRVAAVYGRADARRKTYKPLSMHELAINEAAAQLCKHVPALLTKREELLSLSRQVVRDSGLPYAAISSTFSISLLANGTSTANMNTSPSIQNNNNNDINTKSKYEDFHNGINRHASSLNRDISFSDGSSSSNSFTGFHAKRLRLDGSSAGIEIQEYSNGRPITIQASPSPPTTSNGMQITELRSLPLRRSPSDDHPIHSPLELVTVTTSDLRKNGDGAVGRGSKSASSVSSMDSNSPPIRRPYSVDSADDLTTSSSYGNTNGAGTHLHLPHGIRISQQQTLGNVPSVKVASIPVSGGSISIMNHNGSNGCANVPNHHHHLPQRLHHHHYSSNHHSSMKVLPIKSEPTVN